jgi:hypothetical protein
MDFMKWISSLDELLYEVTSWLLFFPLTLLRAVVHPVESMGYAERQLALPETEQYSAALSPPLFLTLALLITHGISAALGHVDTIIANRHGMASLIDDTSSELVLRLVVFAAFPLFAAAHMVRRSGIPLDRVTLRLPFYSQCYPTAVFALGLGIGASFIGMTYPPAILGGLILIIATIINYVVLETRWFAAKLGIGYVRAFGAVILVFIEGTALLMLISFLLTR